MQRALRNVRFRGACSTGRRNTLCRHEALGLGVVVGIAAPPHGTDEAVVGEDIAVGFGSVLRPAIRVMNAALRRLPYAQSRLQRRNGNAGIDRAADRVANDAARPGIKECCQIDEARRDGDVSDIRHPELVARGIAQMMRVGLYRPVHVKTLRSQKLRMLLTHRKLLQAKAIAVENDLHATLRNFGLKVGVVGRVKFETRIKELVESFPDLVALVEPLLVVRRVLREQIAILHRRVLAAVRDDEVCRRLMTVLVSDR
jgi:hypothetical protein